MQGRRAERSPPPPVTDTHRLRLTERVLHFRCLCTRTDGQQRRVYLALDEVIVLVDLQDVSRVARDGAAVSVVEVASGAAATQICIAD